MKRRSLVLATGALAFNVQASVVSVASLTELDSELQATLARHAAGAPMRVGRISVQIEPLVDNGNSVPVTVLCDSPMTAQDHVTSLAIFTERNPQLEVAEFALGPHSGVARVATRIRMASTQHVVGVAKLSDGTCWVQAIRVIVTLAACIEE